MELPFWSHFFGLASRVRGSQGLCLEGHTSFCFPVKSQGGTNSGVTHAERPGVPGLGQGPGLIGKKGGPEGQYWAMGLGKGGSGAAGAGLYQFGLGGLQYQQKESSCPMKLPAQGLGPMP